MSSLSLSVGCPAALSTAATSAGVRPTPKTLLSLGSSRSPSRSARADSSPILNAPESCFAAGGDSAAAGGTAAAGAGSSAVFEQPASVAKTAMTKNEITLLEDCGIGVLLIWRDGDLMPAAHARARLTGKSKHGEVST